VQGGADALIGMIGLGVAQPGQLALITGSSHLQFGVTSAPLHAPGVWGAYPDIVYPGRWIVEGGQTSTGSIINWLRRFLGGTLDFDAMNAKAAALPPGAEGVIVQDHFQGNRTPYTDPLSRAAIVGLTLAHDQLRPPAGHRLVESRAGRTSGHQPVDAADAPPLHRL